MKGKAFLTAVTALAIMQGAAVAQNAIPAQCTVQLSLQMDPDAAQPRSAAFLNSLLGNPAYTIHLIHGSDTYALVELIGPGDDEGCSQGVDMLSKSSHILELKVVQPNTDTGTSS